MNENKDFQITKRAAGDLARLFSGELTDEDVKTIGAWRQHDEAYQKEFVETSYLIGDLDALRDDPILDKWVNEGGVQDNVVKFGFRSTFFRKSLGAMAALLLLSVGVLFLMPVQQEGVESSYRYVTRIGEQKTITLPDGSVVHLNTNTQLSVTFSDNARNLQLLNGEAYFDVERDEDHPFNVTVGDRMVTVLGTEFNLKKLSDKLSLSVTEGVVALHSVETDQLDSLTALPASSESPVQLDSRKPYRVKAGMVAEVDLSSDLMLAYKDPNILKGLTWRTGVLRFEATPLDKVVEELSRYSAKEIVIVDKDVANLVLYATFRIERLSNVLDAIEYSLPVRIDRKPDRIEIYQE